MRCFWAHDVFGGFSTGVFGIIFLENRSPLKICMWSCFICEKSCEITYPWDVLGTLKLGAWVPA